ncbi:MAG: hypothetical protein J0I79_24455 [Mesorhizobium sp.]|uniref:hypothetical protein n=1 Tax=Mesorhizobium sp. TaxID=1871066 RepID=UPI001AC5C681|nr:hypothetical protein [Mesorhizobium sp.]MBN9221111.1 hypothetical protein [Mesorhizobium sp.]
MPLKSLRPIGLAQVLVSGLLLAAPDVAAAKEQTFNKPSFKYGGITGVISLVRLDWCWNHQQMCGMRAADLYCKSRGFQKVAAFTKDPAIGATVSMGDKKVCNAGICDGFATITCQSP